MCKAFPTEVSCELPNVGAAGGEQNHNGICVLSQNILNEKVQYFYNVKNGSSNITSKSSSKNLSNENIHTLCFQRIGILDHVLS